MQLKIFVVTFSFLEDFTLSYFNIEIEWRWANSLTGIIFGLIQLLSGIYLQISSIYLTLHFCLIQAEA